jgi:hypothetical protein
MTPQRLHANAFASCPFVNTKPICKVRITMEPE